MIPSRTNRQQTAASEAEAPPDITLVLFRTALEEPVERAETTESTIDPSSQPVLLGAMRGRALRSKRREMCELIAEMTVEIRNRHCDCL